MIAVALLFICNIATYVGVIAVPAPLLKIAPGQEEVLMYIPLLTA
jgi:hypothetical protein